MLRVFWTASKTFLEKRVSRELITMVLLWTLEISIREKHSTRHTNKEEALKPLLVIFYRPFDRSMNLWIINKFLKNHEMKKSVIIITVIDFLQFCFSFQINTTRQCFKLVLLDRVPFLRCHTHIFFASGLHLITMFYFYNTESQWEKSILCLLTSFEENVKWTNLREF